MGCYCGSVPGRGYSPEVIQNLKKELSASQLFPFWEQLVNWYLLFLLSLHHEILKSQTVSIYTQDNLVTPFVIPFVKISYIIPRYSMLYYVNETLIIHDKY